MSSCRTLDDCDNDEERISDLEKDHADLDRSTAAFVDAMTVVVRQVTAMQSHMEELDGRVTDMEAYDIALDDAETLAEQRLPVAEWALADLAAENEKLEIEIGVLVLDRHRLSGKIQRIEDAVIASLSSPGTYNLSRAILTITQEKP